MITLKVAYDDNSESLIKELESIIPSKYPLIRLEAYHESLFKERTKAFKLKGGYSARKSPFAVLVNDVAIKAFYSESNDCTIDNITKCLASFISYDLKI